MSIDTTIGSVHIQLDTDRLVGNVREAQKLLNEQIVADCDPLTPFRQGGLRGSVRYPDGIYGGKIMWDTPYAHYQYVGEIYGPNIPIKDAAGNITGFWSPPKKKPTGRPMKYYQPGTGSEWFERAKEKNLDNWKKVVHDALIK